MSALSLSVKRPCSLRALALVALLLGACSGDPTDGASTTTTGSFSTSDRSTTTSELAVFTSTTAPAEPPESVEWTKIADLPMSIFSGSLVAPVEDGIVVVQTESTTVVGLDGSTASGVRPPVTVTPGCCGSAVGIPVGDRLILFDSYAPGTWVLDPETISWNRVGDRPSTGDVLGSALIGDHLYVVTAAARTGAAHSSVAVLDTAAWEWSEIEQVPAAISVGGVTSDGDRLIVAGVRQDSNNNIVGDSREPVAYEYRAEVWRELPDVPIDGQAATVAWVDGAGLLAWNYDLESALLAPSGNWESTGTVPMDFSECYPYSYQVESGLVAVCGGLAHLEAASRAWSPIPIRFEARYVAAGNFVYELAPSGDQTLFSVLHLSTGRD